MRLIISLPTFVILTCLSACAFQDRSLLTKEGDELLDCDALQAEMDFAANLGEDAPARRRHIKAIQEKNSAYLSLKFLCHLVFQRPFNLLITNLKNKAVSLAQTNMMFYNSLVGRWENMI